MLLPGLRMSGYISSLWQRPSHWLAKQSSTLAQPQLTRCCCTIAAESTQAPLPLPGPVTHPPQNTKLQLNDIDAEDPDVSDLKLLPDTASLADKLKGCLQVGAGAGRGHEQERGWGVGGLSTLGPVRGFPAALPERTSEFAGSGCAVCVGIRTWRQGTRVVWAIRSGRSLWAEDGSVAAGGRPAGWTAAVVLLSAWPGAHRNACRQPATGLFTQPSATSGSSKQHHMAQICTQIYCDGSS